MFCFSIDYRCSFFKPNFEIMDENMNPVLKVIGPRCIIRTCPCDNKFQITQLDGESEIGQITNKWNFMAGITKADNFGMECMRETIFLFLLF